MNLTAPTVTIKSETKSREVTTKNGPRTIHFQYADLETESMRVEVELELDGPNGGHPIGKTFDWAIVNDLMPGRFGPELRRKWTLRDGTAAKRAA